MAKTAIRVQTLRQITEQYPPFLVIALATRKMSIPEIAAKSGIMERTLYRLSSATTNKHVKHGQLIALWETCNFNPFCPSSNTHLRYLKRMMKSGTPMPHLTESQWRRFCRLGDKALKEREGLTSSKTESK